MYISHDFTGIACINCSEIVSSIIDTLDMMDDDSDIVMESPSLQGKWPHITTINTITHNDTTDTVIDNGTLC